jgi:DNA-binding IclR family transcriptional regulator
MPETEITAVGRGALEYLADRSKRATTVAKIAEWNDQSLPKTQAALQDLRERGFVRYFAGHPGSWSITADGYREVDVGAQSVDRFQMALQAILLVNSTYHHETDKAAIRLIAKKALGL